MNEKIVNSNVDFLFKAILDILSQPRQPLIYFLCHRFVFYGDFI